LSVIVAVIGENFYVTHDLQVVKFKLQSAEIFCDKGT